MSIKLAIKHFIDKKMSEIKAKAKENEAQNKFKAKGTLPKPASYTIIEDFSESTHSARRNLLIFAIIALFYRKSEAQLSGDLSFLGLGFKVAKVEMIDVFLFFIVLYHLIHFVWLAAEHWKKKRSKISEYLLTG